MTALVLLPTLVASSNVAIAQSAPGAPVPRPPQYVAFAFDGSKSNAMWSETQEFAERMRNGLEQPNTDLALFGLEANQKMPISFTYFVNAAYYLDQGHKNCYIGLGESGTANRPGL